MGGMPVSRNRCGFHATWSLRHWCALAILALVGLGFLAAPAAAHPLGNFTVNRYARVEVSAGHVRVHYVLDLAEIPAFQVRNEVKADPRRFAQSRAEAIGRGLRLDVEGRRLDLRVARQTLSEPPGQGGLSTLRLEVVYQADTSRLEPDSVAAAVFQDTNEPDRIGWREIVAVARGDAVIMESDVPRDDVSDELRSYPEDLSRSPLDRRAATVRFKPGYVEVAASEGDGTGIGRTGIRGVAGSDRFVALVARPGTSLLGTVALLAVAAGFGAVHALGPGHGKTIMAAYVAGERGRPRDAVFLGFIVSLMHTGSVLVVGLALVTLDRRFDAERIYPMLTTLSGALVVAIGGWLLFRRAHGTLQRRRAARAHRLSHDRSFPGSDGGPNPHVHGHEHDHPDHGHGGDGHRHIHDGDDDSPGAGHHHDHRGAHRHRLAHSHGAGHGHTHELPAGVAPLSRRGLVALGGAGGLLPSPSALLVLLSAIALQRVVLGLLIITAFSIGLAAALTTVGLALVYGRSVAERSRLRGTLDMLPVLGAVALLAAGIVLTLRGLSGVQ